MAEAATVRRRPARRGDGERLREEIVEAACRLLNESGDPGTLSLRAVAREVGVATTSIYLHFEDINALIIAVKMRWLDLLADEVQAAAAGASGAPIERVRAVARAYVSAAMTAPNRYRVLFTAPLLPRAPGGPEYLGEAAFQGAFEQVRAAVGEGADADLVTVQFWCALHGLATLRQSRPTFPWPDLEAQLDDLVNRLIRA
jgi:AcrR family transcriptional regulator